MYGDKPFLYGPLLSSINVLRIGAKGEGVGTVEREAEKAGEEVVFEEGAEGDGEVAQRELGVPEEPGRGGSSFCRGRGGRGLCLRRGEYMRAISSIRIWILMVSGVVLLQARGCLGAVEAVKGAETVKRL